MKKLYSLCMLLSVIGVCTLPLSSCSSNDEEGGTQGPQLENAFAYNNAESPIGSVVYTVDDESRVYSIYFSPTQGIIDLEAMLLADDYILITTPTPTGDIDLLAQDGGNSLAYKSFKISAETAANVAKSSLSLQLTSQTTIKMSLDAALTSGETLTANYNGTCFREAEEAPQGEGISLNIPLFSWWRGGSNAGTNNYYMGVSNFKAVVQSGTSIGLGKETGYALVIDCYTNSGSQWKTFPTGTFTESASNEDHTYYDGNSFVVYYDGSNYNMMHLSSDVVISRDENNITHISTTFIDNDGVDHPISFEGDLRVGNGTKMPTLPHLMSDIDFKGYYASAVYEGDIFQIGSGLTEINIIDEAGDNNQSNSYGVNLALFSTKFLDPKNECKLIPGSYRGESTGEQGTWMPTIEQTLLGMIFPTGTYAAFTPEDDGSQTAYYSYCTEGTITVTDLGNSYYDIDLDLEAQTGYKVKGGVKNMNIYLEDQSKDDDNDGSSTLTGDLDLDLNYIKQARCFPQTQVYIVGLGWINVDEITTIAAPAAPEKCGYQYIDLGLVTGEYAHDPTGEYDDPGKLVAGDIFRIDLLVNPGDENKITPGTYTVSPDRYLVSMWPGVCFRGFQAGDGHIGTRWLDISSAIGNGYPKYYHDPKYMVTDGWLNVPSVYGYASLYEGTVTITKADGGDNYFTFEIDGQDVLHHKIKGTWTGPVVLGNSDTPVVDSGKHFEAETTTTAKSEKDATRKSKAPMMRDYVSMDSQSKVQPVPRVTFR